MVTQTEIVKLLPPQDKLIEYKIPEFTGKTNGELWEYKNKLVELILRHNNDKQEIKLWLEAN